MSSFASVNGPSTTVRFPPVYLTRQPFEDGCSPDASSSNPAFASSSWYVVIAANIFSFSGGNLPASESLVALTTIMNRIVASPAGLGLGAGLPGRSQPGRSSVYCNVEREPARSTGLGIFLCWLSLGNGLIYPAPGRVLGISATQKQ